MPDETPLRWATPPAAIAALSAAGLALAVTAAVAVPDAAGRVLVGFAAVLVLVMVALALRQRPRLEVLPGGTGIATMRLTGRREFTRAALHRVRIVEYPRFGRRVPMLEIDTIDPATGTENLMIFGRWDLGTDPRNVHAALAMRDLAPDQTPS
ncbi:PH domain-containing protein [Rhodococcus pyridinivorans]|uniref:PH domain-containing protein n=1 Tax=Rhodococcus TaxID=1827 RepID=UPI001C2FF393|nr:MULTISPECIES: PH domain-containing protein [Rhodococcus]MBX4168882.1 PH domain-containing protein [Rhodococcus sp. DMU2021]QXF82072.1 PH domain-containing protein [Rhodococcus pyridinivorans]